MKVRSATLVQNFEPIRVEIDFQSAEEMDALRDLLRHCMNMSLSKLQRQVIEHLMPAVTRL